MELAISTAWNALRHNSARAIVDELRGLGFDRFELSVHFDETMAAEIAKMQQAGEVEVVSVHHVFPVAPSWEQRGQGRGAGEISSPDETERRKGVELALRTLDWAARLEAQAVVLHLGYVEMEGHPREIIDLALAKDPAAKNLLERDLAIRAERAPKHFEAALKSLRELAAHAASGGPKLGIECRVDYMEIPSFEEFEIVLRELPPTAGGYWHDFGHAQIREISGLEPHERYLEAYGERLIGMHVHDVTPDGRDHRPLTYGGVDFPQLLPLVRGQPLAVLEIHSNAGAEELVRSREIFLSLVRGQS